MSRGGWYRRNWLVVLAALFTGAGGLVSTLMGADDIDFPVVLLSIVIGLLTSVPVLVIESAMRRPAGSVGGAGHPATGDPPTPVPALALVDTSDSKHRGRGAQRPAFYGREAELVELTALHDTERRRRSAGDALGDYAAVGAVQIVIHGPFGIGKSALARELANRLAPQYPDGVLYENFGTAGGPRPPGEILESLLLDLGWSEEEMPEGAEERADIFRSKTVGRRMLFIFDAARHHNQVQDVLPTDRACTVIITSRRDLGPALSAPSLLLSAPDVEEALDIFGAFSGVNWLGCPEAATEIVNLCGRVPLAIRSAAARVRKDGSDVRQVADLLRPWATRLARLEYGGYGVRERIRSEYRRLVPREQLALRLLTRVESPTFMPWVLSPLLQVPIDEAANAMVALSAVHLLDSAGSDRATGFGRYRFNELVLLFARGELLLRPEEHDDDAESRSGRISVGERLTLGYADVVDGIAEVSAGREPTGARRLPEYAQPAVKTLKAIAALPDHGVRAEYGNLVRVVPAMHERGEWASCWRLAAQMHGCVPDSPDLAAVRRMFALAREAAEKEQQALAVMDVQLAEASFLISVERYGWAFRVLTQVEEAVGAWRPALGDPRSALRRRGVAYRKTAEAFLQIGSYDRAVTYLELASAVVAETGDVTEAKLIGVLEADCHCVLSPEPTYEEILEGRLDDVLYFRALLNRSEAARRKSDWKAARDDLLTAYRHSTGDLRRVASVNYRLARLYVQHWRHNAPNFGLVSTDRRLPRRPAGHDPLARSAVRFAAEAVWAFRAMSNVVGGIRADCMLMRALTVAAQLDEAEKVGRKVARELQWGGSVLSYAQGSLLARYHRAHGEVLLCRNDIAAARRELALASTRYGDNGDWSAQAEVDRLITAADRKFGYPADWSRDVVLPAPALRMPLNRLVPLTATARRGESSVTTPPAPRQPTA